MQPHRLVLSLPNRTRPDRLDTYHIEADKRHIAALVEQQIVHVPSIVVRMKPPPPEYGEAILSRDNGQQAPLVDPLDANQLQSQRRTEQISAFAFNAEHDTARCCWYVCIDGRCVSTRHCRCCCYCCCCSKQGDQCHHLRIRVKLTDRQQDG
jgi:hypothetical protein